MTQPESKPAQVDVQGILDDLGKEIGALRVQAIIDKHQHLAELKRLQDALKTQVATPGNSTESDS